MAFEFTQQFYDAELKRVLRLVYGRSIHVFGYGSLMWSPAPHLRDPRLARLHGYSRTLSIYSIRFRGTHSDPGLVLGLDRGGSCWGKVYSVDKAKQDSMIRKLFAREMFAGVYEPRLVRVFENGVRPLDALTFVARRSHSCYAGGLDESEQLRIIATARGERGTCLDYLLRTHEHLEKEGISCPALRHLLIQVVR